jgi:hypothetical protein
MPLSISLTCSEEEQLEVRELSAFLWDINMLHDRIFLSELNPNDPIIYGPNFYRRWRKMPRGLELKAGKVTKSSPLGIELIVATVGGC